MAENFDVDTQRENELDLCTVISRVGSNEPNLLMPNLGDERKPAQTSDANIFAYVSSEDFKKIRAVSVCLPTST